MQAQTENFIYFMAYGDKFLKHIVTYLYCTKCIEINIHRSDKQKHVSYAGSHKKLTYLYCTKCIEINIHHSDIQKHVSYAGSHKNFAHSTGYV